ncbi:MAG: hypothetical protein AAGG48_26000 [Planctomycetota bacterium]
MFVPLNESNPPTEFLEAIDPWALGFLGLAVSDANHRLRQRWSGIELEPLQGLADVLSRFDVNGIELNIELSLVSAVRSGGNEELIGDVFYIPPMLSEEQHRNLILESGLDCDPLLSEFFRLFGGLRELTGLGKFIYDENPWPRFRKSPKFRSEDGKWDGSHILFYSVDGNVLIRRDDGVIGWTVGVEGIISEFAEGSEEFVDQFAEHRQAAWPFDPYGVRE